MTRIVVAPKANADFVHIIDRLAKFAGLAVVEKYASELQSIYGRLSMFPAIGALRPKLGSRTRIVVLRPYIVVYDHLPDADTVRIIRILDGRRNLTRQLVRE